MFRRRSWLSWCALWVAVCALLLKAAVPMVATATAQAQGKTLVEVCTVYGVATVALPDDGSSPGPHSESSSPHAGDHCALSALVVFAGGGDPSPVLHLQARRGHRLAPPLMPPTGLDAVAAWAARQRHGPPVFA